MKLNIEINMDNAAFEDNGEENELGYIFKQLIEKMTLRGDVETLVLRASNGHAVGSALFSRAG